MDEDTKRRCDVIMELYKGCWQRITERRHYEWRAAYTLWSAFGAFITVVITKTELFKQPDVPIGVVFIGIVFCVIHGFWLDGLGKAMDNDRKLAIHYEKKLRSLSKSELKKDCEKCLECQKKPRGLFGDWSRRSQLFVTMVLWFVAIWVVLVIIN